MKTKYEKTQENRKIMCPCCAGILKFVRHDYWYNRFGKKFAYDTTFKCTSCNEEFIKPNN